jgi:triacylglycerol lipase
MIKDALALTPFPQPDVVAIRHPVVFMHGLGIFAAVGRKGQMHEQAMHLRKHGALAFAPNVVPYNTIDVRARAWKGRIQSILDHTGHQDVHLIAHSMGGLDARYMISKLDGFEFVETLTTISTPHRGSSIATQVVEQPDRVRRWITEVMNWLGETAYTDGPADALAAIAELTPEYVNDTFNSLVPDHPSVTYRSYAGRAGKGTSIPINPLLLLYNGKLYELEGVNDGFVSIESAKWGDFQEVLDADHSCQLGLRRTPGNSFDSSEFFLSVARDLAALEAEKRRSTDPSALSASSAPAAIKVSAGPQDTS